MRRDSIRPGEWYETRHGVGQCKKAGGCFPWAAEVKIVSPIPLGTRTLKPGEFLRRLGEAEVGRYVGGGEQLSIDAAAAARPAEEMSAKILRTCLTLLGEVAFDERVLVVLAICSSIEQQATELGHCLPSVDFAAIKRSLESHSLEAPDVDGVLARLGAGEFDDRLELVRKMGALARSDRRLEEGMRARMRTMAREPIAFLHDERGRS